MIRHVFLWAFRIAVPVLMLTMLATFARLPMGQAPEHGSMRLAWRMVGEKIRLCRDYTPEEKKTLALHMRAAQHCENRLLTYRLKFELNGKEYQPLIISPSGARGDRPLFVNTQIRLPPGPYHLKLRFAPLSPEELLGGDPKAPENQALKTALAEALKTAGVFTFDESFTLKAGQVWMLDLKESAGKFSTHQR